MRQFKTEKVKRKRRFENEAPFLLLGQWREEKRERGSRTPESVFGPAEGGEFSTEAGERQADDIEIAAFDLRNVAAGAALDGVSAGFVERLAGGEIAKNFLRVDRGEANLGGFDEGVTFGVGQANERDARDDGVGAVGQFFEHAASIVRGTGLAENDAVEGDNGI